MSEKTSSKTTVAYTRQLGVIVYDAIIDGKSYVEIAEMDGMPDTTGLMVWLRTEKDFQDIVSAAREYQKARFIAEIQKIADSADPSIPGELEKARLQCEVKMWLVDKLY
ncbi:terminase small subunit-like protein [Citrobacter braakii]|uniref:terminase small subunit-like protein n=1 Tax=Citrobacter braakii TaxID=57706 RepID=UPI004039A120